ncbi:hypothetical protein Tco_0797557, partial [Tanacetum coccineum]
MVISSPCLIDNKELTSPEQTAPGKDFSNPLIVDSLLKTIWSSMHHVFTMKHWLVQSKRLLDEKHQFLNRSHICYALTKKPDVCVSFIKQFWRSAEVSTAENGEVKITTTIDGHSMTITEGSLRRHLKLADQEDMQRNQLQQHTRSYHVPSLSMKVFNNIKRPTKAFSGQEVALFPTMLAVTTPSTSPSRITSSPSHSPEHSPSLTPSPSPEPTPDHTTANVTQPSPTQPSPTIPSPGVEHHFPTPHDLPLHAIYSHGSNEVSTAEVNLSTAGETVTYTRRSVEKRSRQDKGKSIMIESEPKNKSKKELEQERLSFAEAIRLEEQMNEEQRAQIARDEEIARQWDEEERQRAMAEAKTSKKIDWNDPSVISTRKRQKLEEDAEKEELKGFLDIIPREEVPMEVESLSTNSKKYKILSEMLEDFDRQDVEELYRLVKEKYSASRLEG